jgi:hypothetical protein
VPNNAPAILLSSNESIFIKFPHDSQRAQESHPIKWPETKAFAMDLQHL